ncbi:MAG: hypothetical protein RIC87_10770 [Kiloniellales bacterium]
MSGKALRSAAFLNAKTGRSFSVALDHGMQLGPVPGLNQARPIIKAAVELGAEGLLLTPGQMQRNADVLAVRGRPAIMLRVDQTSMWRQGSPTGYVQGQTRLVGTVEDAMRLGADAVITFLFTCHQDPELENRSIEICGMMAERCRSLGMALVVEPMAARGGLYEDPFTAEAIAMNCRIAADMGADILKTDWSGDAESFAEVVAAVDIPVLLAGGAALTSEKKTKTMVGEIMKSGAKGLVFGRNIFQAPNPKRMMRDLQKLVHNTNGREAGAKSP